MKKLVLVLGYRRPDYLRQCLEAIAKCRGVEDYGVLVSIDGGEGHDPQCVVVAEAFKSQLNLEVMLLLSNYGINWHNEYLVSVCFRLTDPTFDFIVVVEDDCILSPDALELADWFYAHPRRDEYLCMSLGRVSKSEGDHTVPGLIDEAPNLCSPHGWCLTRAAWEKMKPVWNSKQYAPTGWDFSLAWEMFKHGWKSLAPQLSRTLNIGREGGVNSYPAWFDEHMVGQIVSDANYRGPYEITNLLPDDWTLFPKEWMKGELENERIRNV